MKRRKAGTPTRVPERIDALLGIVGQTLSDWADVRYQLLTAICGTILQARMDLQDCTDLSGCGVFVVHEFQTNSTTPENLQRNYADYRAFLKVLGIRLDNYRDGVLLGPVTVGGMDCFFGKASKCPTVVLGVAGKGTKVGSPGC